MHRAFLMFLAAGRRAALNLWPAPLLAAPAIVMMAFGVGATPTETRSADEYFFSQTFGDLREEASAAREQGKHGILLFFEADACPYCQHMRHKVFSRPDVQDWYRERFLSIAVDIHGDIELTDFDGITLPSKVFSDHRRVFLTPVVSFIDLDGNEVYRHVGMVRTSEEMLLLGKYIEGRHYYDTEYPVFAERLGAQQQDVLVTPGEETE
jgi:thioredoxin-related protein